MAVDRGIKCSSRPARWKPRIVVLTGAKRRQASRVAVCRDPAGKLGEAHENLGAAHEDVAMDVVEKIKTELSSSPVILFMKGTPDFPQCGFSAQTVAALRAVGADFKHVNIFEEPELREALKRYSNWPTYPQLYVNGELVGGCDIALEMYRSGELKKLLSEAGAVTA
jgi:monothiol glutaredoxin